MKRKKKNQPTATTVNNNTKSLEQSSLAAPCCVWFQRSNIGSGGTVENKQQEFPSMCLHFLCSLFGFDFLIHTLLSQGSQRGTYLMLPSLFSAAAVALGRGARTLPGTQPSAAGERSLAGWYTRHMSCWLTARTWTTSPWLTQISFSFSA